MTAMLHNLRDLPRAMSVSALLSGLLVVVVGCSGPLLIMIDAGTKAGLSQAQISSWIWAVTVGGGVLTIFMSLRYRQPVLAAFSTPGAALLVTSLPHFPFPVAVGAYLIAGLLVTLVGLTGLFSRVMNLIPQAVVLGMLAGVLFRFGVGLFTAFPEQPVIVGAMILVYYVLKRLKFRAPTLGALLVGFVIAGASGTLRLENVSLSPTVPVITLPEFTLEGILSLSLPLFLLAMTGQNAPGFAVLKTSGYQTPIDETITATGVASMLTAPLGGHSLTLSAITAAMATSPEAHPDPTKRYAAGISTGVFYILFGIFSTTAVSLFANVPGQLIAALTGLALSSAIISSASGALNDLEGREAGLAALLCTASGVKIFEIGAPFWGLIAGVAVYLLLKGRALRMAYPVR